MSGMWYCYTLTAFFFINFSTCGTLNKILFYMFGVIVLLVFHETDPTFWCFLLIFKVRSKRGLLNTWQRIKADFIALSYCADGSALQLHYYNLLIACSACVFSNRPEAESGARSSFRYIWDSANPLLVIFFSPFFLIVSRIPAIISTYSMVIWDTTSNVVKSALAKLSLYWPILMASSHSSTMLKLEKSGMLRSRRGRWTLKGTQAGPVKNNDNTKWQLEHQSQSRPPGYDSKMNYYITFSKFETELPKIPPALSMNQYFPKWFLIKGIFQMKW